MAEENSNENDVKALLQRCADSLLSAVSQIGRSTRTNTQTTNNSRSDPNVSTSSSGARGSGTGSSSTSNSATVSTLRPRKQQSPNIDDFSTFNHQLRETVCLI